MPKRDAEHETEVATTGHEWDGIREFDNPLPRWWLWVFYASIAVAIVYWFLMPAWPGVSGYSKGILGYSDRANVETELQALQTVRGAQSARLKSATLEQIEADPALLIYAQAVGASVFGDNCATCHGTGGSGGKGYANLRDDVWLWGGGLDEIHHTLQVGVRSGDPDSRFSQMPAFGKDQLLSEAQIGDLTEFVVALSGRPASSAAVRRAAPTFVAQCASCHGVNGGGNVTLGAPDLTDQEWLYGAARADIHEQIWAGRGGVMPAWRSRFDPETLKALAVYIHANAGGR